MIQSGPALFALHSWMVTTRLTRTLAVTGIASLLAPGALRAGPARVRTHVDLELVLAVDTSARATCVQSDADKLL